MTIGKLFLTSLSFGIIFFFKVKSFIFISLFFYFFTFLIFLIFFKFLLIFIFLLYNAVLVLPYTDMNQPWVYMSSQYWTHFPPLWIISLDHPRAPAPSILYPVSNIDWQFVSYMIVYIFNAILPNHPTLSLSHRVQKSVLNIWVSFAVSHRGFSLPSF